MRSDYTGHGVGAPRFGALVALDLFGGGGGERTQLKLTTIASPEPGAADLRSGFYLSASPEGRAATLAGVEVAKQVCGLPMPGFGIGSDAKAPDFQDGIEAGGVLDALLGADSLVGLRYIDGAQITSLAIIDLHHNAVGLIGKRLAAVAARPGRLPDRRRPRRRTRRPPHGPAQHTRARTRMRVDSDVGRRILREAGASVDEATRIVRLPELVEHALAAAPRRFDLGDASPAGICR
jgi:hypothetical protein